MKVLFTFFIAASTFLSVFFINKSDKIQAEDLLYGTLKNLGDEPVNHELKKGTFASAELGKKIVHEGKGKADGRKSRRQSKEFVCTSCHNVTKESDLFYNNPDSKLQFSKEKNLPFTQATTFWGVVNRTSFYNGDYYSKYGESVKEANGDLRNAIQLCAVQCAQGRPLKDWEIESVLAYFWTLELKIEDLDISKSELSDKSDTEAIDLLKSKYAAGAPATFDKKLSEAIPSSGNPENGKVIYEQGCLHCHSNKEYSFYQLDNSKLTFKHLSRMIGSKKLQDVHYISRNGTLPSNGEKAYMPNYTIEKMSNQHIADLISYIQKKAN